MDQAAAVEDGRARPDRNARVAIGERLVEIDPMRRPRPTGLIAQIHRFGSGGNLPIQIDERLRHMAECHVRIAACDRDILVIGRFGDRLFIGCTEGSISGGVMRKPIERRLWKPAFRLIGDRTKCISEHGLVVDIRIVRHQGYVGVGIGPDRDGALKLRHRRVLLSDEEEDIAVEGMRDLVVRHQPNERLRLRQRLVRSLEPDKQVHRLDPRILQIGYLFDREEHVGEGRLAAPEHHAGMTPLIIEKAVAGLDQDGAIEQDQGILIS